MFSMRRQSIGFAYLRRMTAYKNKTTLVTFLALLLLSLSVTLKMVAPYLLSILMGGILAVLSYPFYQKLRDRRMGPKTSAACVTLAVTLLVILPLAAFAMVSVKQAIAFGQYLASQEGFSFQSILDKVSQLPVVRSLISDPSQIQRQLQGNIQSFARAATSSAVAIASQLPELLLQTALSLITFFFMLLDGKRFVRWMISKLPLEADVRISLVQSFHDTTVSVIWATLAAAAVQSVLMFAGFLALGVPGAVLAAGATFIFAWIPVLGSFPVWTAGIIYLVAQGSIAKAVVMLGIGFLTGVADNFVRPLVLKGRGDMHPLVSLVAIFGGISMFGIFGVFYGPILTAILLSLLHTWPKVALRFGLMAPEATDVSSTPLPTQVADQSTDPATKKPGERKTA